MANGHAARHLQPSQFKRTINCPGWGNLTKDIPDTPSGDFANEGTLAHDIAACCLSRGQKAEVYLGRTGYVNDKGGVAYEAMGNAVYTKKIDDEMVGNVQVYIDAVRDLETRLVNPVILIEQKLDLSWLVPGMYGTGDHIAVEALGALYVSDLKYGAGVSVDVGAEVGDNPQLSIYALGALGERNLHMVEEVAVRIIQPRAPHSEGPIREIRYDVDDLYQWGREVLLPAAMAAEKPGAPLHSGDWCRWCPGQQICPEIRRKMFATAEIPTDESHLPVSKAVPLDPMFIDSEKMDRILAFADVFEDWIKNVRAEAHRRLEAGEASAPTQYKLVQGKLPNRSWANEAEAVKSLEIELEAAELFEPAALKSPTVVEKALKKNGYTGPEVAAILNPLLKERTPGKASMVPITDARPALPPSVERMFGNE